jgi:hypothetical protein
VPIGDQAIAKVRPDESGRTGDERSHRGIRCVRIRNDDIGTRSQMLGLLATSGQTCPLQKVLRTTMPTPDTNGRYSDP